MNPISEVYHANCLEYMYDIPNLFFDWALCDIEYGIGASKPSKKLGTVKQKNGTVLQIKQSDYKHTDWDLKKSPPEYFKELFRISKKQIIFGGNYYGLSGGYLVWDKLNGATDQYDCEMAWLSFTNRMDLVYYMWSGMMQGAYIGRDIHKAQRQIGNKKLNEKRIHETQKPVALYDWIINKYDVKGRVFDSHLGSGSNRIANYINGNDFYACEIGKDKFDAQNERFQQFISEPRLFI